MPIVVRFAPHAAVHRVPGVRLDPNAARVTSTSTVVRGSYGRAFPGLTARDLADVSSVRLATHRPQRSRTAPTHRVVVEVVDPQGDPASGVVVTLFNVDEASTFQDTTGDGGRTRFEVPEGHYSALGFTSIGW